MLVWGPTSSSFMQCGALYDNESRHFNRNQEGRLSCAVVFLSPTTSSPFYLDAISVSIQKQVRKHRRQLFYYLSTKDISRVYLLASGKRLLS